VRLKGGATPKARDEMAMVLTVLKRHGDPFMTAEQVAQKMLWKERQAEIRLRWLVNDGKLVAERRPPQRWRNNTLYYRLPEEGEIPVLVAP